MQLTAAPYTTQPPRPRHPADAIIDYHLLHCDRPLFLYMNHKNAKRSWETELPLPLRCPARFKLKIQIENRGKRALGPRWRSVLGTTRTTKQFCHQGRKAAGGCKPCHGPRGNRKRVSFSGLSGVRPGSETPHSSALFYLFIFISY